MVTDFAKEMIKNADSCGAQDIYVFHVRIITSSICELARRGD